MKQHRQYKIDTNAKGFAVTGKKFYDNHAFENSNEFKQLGTLTKENRMADYFPPDQLIKFTSDRELMYGGDNNIKLSLRKNSFPSVGETSRELRKNLI